MRPRAMQFKLNSFSKYSWGVLIYNLIVILFGAYVRATGSGAGCGSHWPLCNGVFLPREPRFETVVEFTHRGTSGIALLSVVFLLIWAFRTYPPAHRVRLGSTGAMFFMITEALIGAGLVLFQLVADNTTMARAISLAIHLVNTFFLLAFLTLTAWWASGGLQVTFSGNKGTIAVLGIGILGMVILGASGAITALGDTLFPATSFVEGLAQDLSPTAHMLVRLRFLHPILAILVSIYLIITSRVLVAMDPRHISPWIARGLPALIAIQVLAGVLNIFLLAPVWLQILHLLLTDLIWISLILFTASLLSDQIISVALQDSPITQSTPIEQSSGMI